MLAEKQAEDSRESLLVSSTQDQSQSQRHTSGERAQAKDPSSESQVERTKPEDSGSDGADVSKGRPMSPSTLALMCDEGDTMFTSAASSSGLVECNEPSQLPIEPGLTESYAEQERIVLTKFRECLNRLITLGEIKETKYSSLARRQSGAEKDLTTSSSSISNESIARSQQPISNGVAILAPPPTPPVVSVSQDAVNTTVDHQKITHGENGDVKTKPESEL